MAIHPVARIPFNRAHGILGGAILLATLFLFTIPTLPPFTWGLLVAAGIVLLSRTGRTAVALYPDHIVIKHGVVTPGEIIPYHRIVRVHRTGHELALHLRGRNSPVVIGTRLVGRRGLSIIYSRLEQLLRQHHQGDTPPVPHRDSNPYYQDGAYSCQWIANAAVIANTLLAIISIAYLAQVNVTAAVVTGAVMVTGIILSVIGISLIHTGHCQTGYRLAFAGFIPFVPLGLLGLFAVARCVDERRQVMLAHR